MVYHHGVGVSRVHLHLYRYRPTAWYCILYLICQTVYGTHWHRNRPGIRQRLVLLVRGQWWDDAHDLWGVMSRMDSISISRIPPKLSDSLGAPKTDASATTDISWRPALRTPFARISWHPCFLRSFLR